VLAGRGGAQIIYSAAAGRQWALHAGVISPHFLLPLGYEHYDIRLPGLCTVLVRPADQPSRPAAGAWLEGPSLASRPVWVVSPLADRVPGQASLERGLCCLRPARLVIPQSHGFR
jgi:hypothetical protein